MFINSICKEQLFIVGKQELPYDIIAMIDQYLPHYTYCDECENTLLFSSFHLKCEIKNDIPPVKCWSDKLITCSYCRKTTLCPKHAERAQKYAKMYNSITPHLCDNCCWDHV